MRERIEPAAKMALAILSELRANFKAIVCIHGEDSPYTLGFKLHHLNQLIDFTSKKLYLCDAMVVHLSNTIHGLIRKKLKFLNLKPLKLK